MVDLVDEVAVVDTPRADSRVICHMAIFIFLTNTGPVAPCQMVAQVSIVALYTGRTDDRCNLLSCVCGFFFTRYTNVLFT
jgi:hypothetical protein